MGWLLDSECTETPVSGLVVGTNERGQIAKCVGGLYICITMSSDRKSIPVSLPPDVVAELDRLVDEGKFSSRSEALRYGARLVTHQEATKRLHEHSQQRARDQVWDRLDRKREARE